MPCNYNNYPSNWKTVIRPAILERAKGCCEQCGVKNHSLIHRNGSGMNDWVYWPEGMESESWSLDGLKSTFIVLTISHTDHDTTHNDYSNLRALCQKCHLNHDKHYHRSNKQQLKLL
jgi:hypothetical protein